MCVTKRLDFTFFFFFAFTVVLTGIHGVGGLLAFFVSLILRFGVVTK